MQHPSSRSLPTQFVDHDGGGARRIIDPALTSVRSGGLFAGSDVFDAVSVRAAALERLRAEAVSVAQRNRATGSLLGQLLPPAAGIEALAPAITFPAADGALAQPLSPPRAERGAAVTSSPLQLALQTTRYVWAATQGFLSAQLAPLTAQLAQVSQLISSRNTNSAAFAPVFHECHPEHAPTLVDPASHVGSFATFDARAIIKEPSGSRHEREKHVEAVARQFAEVRKLEIPKKLTLLGRFEIYYGLYVKDGRRYPPLWLALNGNPCSIWGKISRALFGNMLY